MKRSAISTCSAVGLDHVIADAAACRSLTAPRKIKRYAHQQPAMRAVDDRRAQAFAAFAERAHPGREAAERRGEDQVALVGPAEAAVRQLLALAVVDPHRRAAPPDVAGIAEHRLHESPARGDRDGEVVECALVVRALAELDRRGIGAGAEHEALDPRVRVVALGDHERAALLDPARRDRLERFLERPPRGQPEVDRERVGLAARNDDQRRPGLAEIARAARQHVAHGAVAAGDDDIVDAPLGEAGEHVLQLAALGGSLDEEVGAAAPVGKRGGLAVAAQVADHARRAGPGARARPRPPTGRRAG